MDKYLITLRTENPITGPIMVTTSPRFTCPLTCAFRKGNNTETAGVCYAEHGALGGFIWTLLDRSPAGRHIMNGVRVHDFSELLYAIRSLPSGSLWRHNIAGDLPSNNRTTIDASSLNALVEANSGRKGFTFTHYDVLTNLANRLAIAEANKNGFTINLSGNSLEHADQLADLRIAPVTTILPAETTANATTPNGRTVVICPTSTHGVTCADCGLYARASRSTIIGFPASGGLKDRIKKETNHDTGNRTAPLRPASFSSPGDRGTTRAEADGGIGTAEKSDGSAGLFT